MITVNILPFVKEGYVEGVIKKVRVFGITLYEKRVLNPPKEIKDWVLPAI